MDDLISRAAALDVLITSPNFHTTLVRIEELPAVDAVPIRRGRWIKMMGMMPPEYHGHYECSECQWHMKGLRNSWTREEEMTYCPNCGARMSEG